MGIKGLDTLADVIDVIKNPDKFDAKVNELKTLVSQYTEVAEAVVKLSEVNDYTRSIRDREQLSKEALENAKVAATDIVNDAKIKAAELKKKAQVTQDKADADALAASLQLDAATKQLTSNCEKEAELVKRLAEVAEREVVLANQEKELEQRKVKLLEAFK